MNGSYERTAAATPSGKHSPAISIFHGVRNPEHVVAVMECGHYSTPIDLDSLTWSYMHDGYSCSQNCRGLGNVASAPVAGNGRTAFHPEVIKMVASA